MWSVSQEIKSTATAHVAGTIFEKVFYKSVVALAIVLFISNSYSVLHSAATKKVTDIKLTVVDSMPFPALWVCAPTQSVDKFSFRLQADFCTGGSSVGQVSFFEKRFGESTPKALTCSNATSNLDHDIIKGLRAFMNSTYGQSECLLIADPSHVATRGEFQKLAFSIESVIPQERQHENNPGIVTGVLDGTKSWAEQQESFGQGILTLDAFSSVSEVKFSMDKFVDVPFSFLGFGGEAKTVMSYHSTSSSGRVVAVNKPGRVSSDIYVSAGNFVTREITSRYKTFSEVCAEIGGLWAISVMVVTAFFVGKTVQGKEQTDPSVPVQVFRLRGLSSQKEACREIALMLRDTHNAAQENDLAGVAGA